jgi:hypothetical protein
MLQIRSVSDLRNKFPEIESVVNTGEIDSGKSAAGILVSKITRLFQR